MAPIPVIIDTDPGVDDVLAILLALASPELQVLAIIVSYGNSDLAASYANALRIYQVLSQHFAKHPEDKEFWPNFSQERKTILAQGATEPLEGVTHSAKYFHGRDGLGDITDRFPHFNLDPPFAPCDDHPQLILTDKPGVDVALDLISSEPSQSITYIVLGPMTTLSQIVQKSGETFKENIGRVICMGGALDVPGNATPVAEFNFYADPFAVQYLLTPSPKSNFPLDRFILLPLDITTPHELPFPYYTSHVDAKFPSVLAAPTSELHAQGGDERPPLIGFTSAFLERTREVMLEFGKDLMELHDIAAVWCAIAHPSLTKTSVEEHQAGWGLIKRHFQVERIGELTRGMLVTDRRDDKSAYAPGSNRASVQAELEKHAEFHAHGVLESNVIPAQVEVETASQAQSILEAIEHSKDGEGENPGVLVVAETPGPQALLELLARRVWGVGRRAFEGDNSSAEQS